MKTSVRIAGVGVVLFAFCAGALIARWVGEEVVTAQSHPERISKPPQESAAIIAVPPKVVVSPTPAVTDRSARSLADAAASDDQAALQTLQQAAAKGIPAAQYGLGLYYGTKVESLVPLKNCAPSTAWLRVHDPALAKLRDKFDPRNGANMQANALCEQAISWLEKAAFSGDLAAQAQLGHEYYASVAQMKALGLAYANANNMPSAQMEQQLENSRTSKAECAEALHWLNTAANSHDSDAEATLGMAYQGGIACVTADDHKGMDLLQRSAADGNLAVGVVLAGIYWGKGQFTEAHHLVEKAERQGADDDDTADALVMYYKSVDTNDEIAEHWENRVKTIQEDQETKYPILKLIHEKLQDQSESSAGSSPSDQNDQDEGNTNRSSAAENLPNQNKIILARGLLCGSNDLLNQVVNSGHIPDQESFKSVADSMINSMELLGFTQDEAATLLRDQLVGLTQGAWAITACPIYEQQANSLIATIMK